MSENLINKINTLIDKYEPQLTRKGIGCKLSKKYFEVKTNPSYSTSSLLSKIHRFLANRREDKYFNHQNNRYQCIVLHFYPIENNNLKVEDCREYAFLLSKIERIEEGYAPKSKIFKEEKILNKIEKLIKKILRKAEKNSTKQVCKEVWYDVFRYIFNYEYGYKKRILGKDRFVWEVLFSSIISGIIIALCVGIFLITKQ